MPPLRSEFQLIRDVFARHAGAARSDVLTDIGDDGAVLAWSGTADLVASTDTLAAGRHFLPDAAPADLGYKCLAVNLSDLAAMGAEPVCFLLSLSLPGTDEALGRDPAAWLEQFARGMASLATRHGVRLVGGDTIGSDGPVQIGITALGRVPHGTAVGRRGARAGDRVWVSGTLGDAALALLDRRQALADPADRAHFAARLDRPSPRVALGMALRENGLAHAMIDVSDGLLADLGHILSASGARAELRLDALPLSASARRLQERNAGLLWPAVLGGGDDYELCLTADPADAERIRLLGQTLAVPLTEIGEITQAVVSEADDPLADPGGRITVLDADGRPYPVTHWGHDHFAAP